MPPCGGAAAAPHAVSGGGEARGSRGGGRRGRRARGGGGWGGGGRGGVHPAFGLVVHPLLHEALEGGEVAVHRRIAKSLLRLRAQPSALSASQEPGWGPRLGQGWGWSRGSGHLALRLAHPRQRYTLKRMSEVKDQLNLIHEIFHLLVHGGPADLPRRVVLRPRALELDVELRRVRLVVAKTGGLDILPRALPLDEQNRVLSRVPCSFFPRQTDPPPSPREALCQR